MSRATHKLGRRRFLRLASGGLLATIGAQAAAGDDSATKEKPAENGRLTDDQRRRERWKRVMKEYKIVARTEPETVLHLKSEPALHWMNPVRGGDDGLVFVWVVDGKPRAVMCYYRVPWEGRMLESHEFQSLSVDALVATRGQSTVWSTFEPGVAWRPFPGAARPAATPAERLRQLRGLAREFQLVVDVDKQKTDLRLLPQPVYRYESRTDGALFNFALTTDPEAWLLIEERPDGDKSAWHYAFGRMTSHPVVASHQGKVVWEVSRLADYTNPRGTYYLTWTPAPIPEP